MALLLGIGQLVPGSSKGRAQLLDRKGEGKTGDTSGTQANSTGGAKSAETRYVYIRINSIGATILSKCVKKQI